MADLLESKKYTCLLNGRFPRQIKCNAFKMYPITPVAVEQRTGASSLFVETGSEMGAAQQFKALPGQVTQAETGARAVTPRASLTCWRLHVQILQQGGVFGDVVSGSVGRLFRVWISRWVSTRRSKEAAVCRGLS